jgi:NDP-sugar pyrophosphorylase family protein
MIGAFLEADMKTAVVLAGGHGVRLWPLTERLPKPMISIDDRPIMEFVVSALRSSGFRKLLVILQHNPGPIVEHFGGGERFGVTIDYALQDGDLGTAGSVRQVLGLVDGEDLTVVSSDILWSGDLLQCEEFHHATGASATVVLSQVDDPSEFGSVKLAKDGRIVEFHEKTHSGSLDSRSCAMDSSMNGGAHGAGPYIVSAGIYFFRRSIFSQVPAEEPFDFGRDLLPRLLRCRESVYGWTLPGYWRDIGTFKGLEAARADIRANPLFKNLITRWPASRSGEGGRIWTHWKAPAREWLEMDLSTIGQAAGIIWKYLATHNDRPATIAELQKLKGVGANDAMAAIGWLAREGKLVLKQEGRTTKVQLTPAEIEATSTR